MQREPLPIDDVLDEAIDCLRSRRRLVLEAPPGAGKTTRVPPAILAAGLCGDGQVIVLEPRRLAARLSALRVAEEMGERVGETVGYQVRFDDVGGPRTRLRYVTEGILCRRLCSDPTLAGVGAVVLDEFHERHLATDVCLARLALLQAGPRPDLHLAVMSATIDAEPVVRFLEGAAHVRSTGRSHEVFIEHLATPDDRPLELQVERAVRRATAEPAGGDVLVFLPGAAEIRRAAAACSELAARRDLSIVPLHGDLAPAEQDRAVRPGSRPKVILSTNVAETSVTIAGVTTVVDSGLARVAGFSAARGLPTLRLARVSRASAAQRAGRAGRTGPGRAFRLYTKHDHDTRPAFETPEVRRLDLAETVLELRASGIDPGTFPWLEAPDPAAISGAGLLLERLGALDERLAVTETGRQMLRFPLHPRLARLLVEAARRGVAEEGAGIAALLAEGDLRPPRERRTSAMSDLVEALESNPTPAARRVSERLARLAGGRQSRPEAGAEHVEQAILQSVLAAYPDRVCRRRRSGSPEVLMSAGGAAVVAESSVVRDAQMLVAADVEERERAVPLVRAASAIEADWLLDLFPHRIRETAELSWNQVGERVLRTSRMLYDDLVLTEDRRPAAPCADVTRILAGAALEAGFRAFADGDALERLVARVDLVARSLPESGVQPLGEAEVRSVITDLCESHGSFAELRDADLVGTLRARLRPAHAALVATEAPEKIALPSGRSARVEYASGEPPWLASRLQDFFGMAAGPTLCRGRVPVVLHLLAPNRRAVQITTDLAGFWTRHYPSIRRELARRYPKHAWPEDPLSAKVK
ncbi:MAG: ATP-dependent helicase HrpB [Deltaproteobacteria bacterium]|nr:ATP-dependent helicase HrpB [Deltaproteobacteria bacterium]